MRMNNALSAIYMIDGDRGLVILQSRREWRAERALGNSWQGRQRHRTTDAARLTMDFIGFHLKS